MLCCLEVLTRKCHLKCDTGEWFARIVNDILKDHMNLKGNLTWKLMGWL